MAIDSLPGGMSSVYLDAAKAIGPASQLLPAAILLDRYDRLRGQVMEQASLVSGLNTEMRSLEHQKALLMEQGLPAAELDQRLAELYSQGAEIASRVSVEMARLQNMSQMMSQASDELVRGNKTSFFDPDGTIRNLR